MSEGRPHHTLKLREERPHYERPARASPVHHSSAGCDRLAVSPALGSGPVAKEATYQCGDQIHNDGDGLTDYADDPQCIARYDYNELPQCF